MSDTYRLCAGIVVFNRAKKVLMCARADKRGECWQFPQGGIMKKETPAQAALRELKEETSVKSVCLIKTLETPIRYDFPPSVRRRMEKRGILTRGQEMYWSLCRLDGTDDEINLCTETPEFKAWSWVEPSEAVERIVYFKRDVYRQMMTEFIPLIEADQS
jgi:putative (di)nucleoside polyphosphate hydrolase